MGKNIMLSEWINNFISGSYSSTSVHIQIQAGWYDWFCKDTSLMNKTKRIGNILKQIKSGGKIDLELSYVWFKNNCPLNGSLYDDFRIADIDSNVTLLIVQIDGPLSSKRYSVFERLNGFKQAIFETDLSTELVDWLNKGWF
jgi:hypothetical protein